MIAARTACPCPVPATACLSPQAPWPDGPIPEPIPIAGPRGVLDHWRQIDLARARAHNATAYAHVVREVGEGADLRFDVELRGADRRIRQACLLPSRYILERWPLVLPGAPDPLPEGAVPAPEWLRFHWRRGRPGGAHPACYVKEEGVRIAGGPHVRVDLVDAEGRRTEAALTVAELLSAFPEWVEHRPAEIPEVGAGDLRLGPRGSKVVVGPATHAGEHSLRVLDLDALDEDLRRTLAREVAGETLSPAAILARFPERIAAEKPAPRPRSIRSMGMLTLVTTALLCAVTSEDPGGLR